MFFSLIQCVFMIIHVFLYTYLTDSSLVTNSNPHTNNVFQVISDLVTLHSLDGVRCIGHLIRFRWKMGFFLFFFSESFSPSADCLLLSVKCRKTVMFAHRLCSLISELENIHKPCGLSG